MSNMFYTVRRGDTLTGIAQSHGTTVKRLQKINSIESPDRIYDGQVIALTERAVCKVDVQLLDVYRNPIKNAKMRLDYSGKSKHLSSGKNGRLPTILTKSPEDTVKIFIERMDGGWKQITEVTSDWGNKLVTLVSPKIKIETKTMRHPQDKNGKLKADPGVADRKSAEPPKNPDATEAKGRSHGDYGDGKGPKSEQINDKHGFPFTKVTNDQAKLDFLGGYTGEKITDENYERAARSIGCEVSFLKAVAMVETGDRTSGFDEKNRPIILYERHVFARCTNPAGKYNKINPDISSSTGYKAASLENKNLVSIGKLKKDEIYGYSYGRLAKAYSLDKNAAMQACSWGKFQILGENHKEAGFETVLSFVQAMCISEREHLLAFANFIKSDLTRKNAAITKDWAVFSKMYNGRHYKRNKYDTKLKEAYKEICERKP